MEEEILQLINFTNDIKIKKICLIWTERLLKTFNKIQLKIQIRERMVNNQDQKDLQPLFFI